ncbi:hypothetical protein [Mycolicibacter arupensis]|uniref:Uncharacterized protein n=1 Tax=Mycolicibacter arupensis TaxID=342002 RepID=A0A5C7Y366_9MYCO|nr:hypothetical protein [Mycolicibacter arupensis]TXI55928.1 MAG: hypothetical protein E6Q54_11925 [Mycolicibacter arupensis]
MATTIPADLADHLTAALAAAADAANENPPDASQTMLEIAEVGYRAGLTTWMEHGLPANRPLMDWLVGNGVRHHAAITSAERMFRAAVERAYLIGTTDVDGYLTSVVGLVGGDE